MGGIHHGIQATSPETNPKDYGQGLNLKKIDSFLEKKSQKENIFLSIYIVSLLFSNYFRRFTISGGEALIMMCQAHFLIMVATLTDYIDI
jgi:hypothetical protein